MQLTMLKAKLHRACVTDACVDYEGSCAIDADLLALSGIKEYEQIQIYNVTNGERLTTYAIQAEAGSRVISVNGAAAHKANIGDRIIICSYVQLPEEAIAAYEPTLVYFDETNKVIDVRNKIPEQKPRLVSNQ